ncbi:hypothetical protein DL546_003380 [Coniochaeta pulveracea]|uniref:Aminoglycoside phosphotransferase domain-containing protein n=1 Tax=Coniochaeta pulveracea TaxID=177199 RepID=A0A420Y5D0_9PEZI|nr:hypothetical protein DL546_003380 [Coniochaeta pulveracea]
MADQDMDNQNLHGHDMVTDNEKQGIREVAKQIFRRQDPNADFTFLRLFVINPRKVAVVWDPNTFGVRQKEILFYFPGEPRLWDRLVVTLPASHEYLNTKTNLPVGRCIQVDRTASNPIGRSYLVTNETPAGRRLDTVLDQLSFQQRLDLADKLGTLLGGLVSREVECDEAGILIHRTAPVPGTTNPSSYELIPLPDVGNVDTLTGERADIASLRTHFAPCQPDAVSRGWLVGARFTYIDEALVMPDAWHIVQDHARDTVEITRSTISHEGVLAPSLIACQPPAWLWGANDDPAAVADLLGWQKSVKERFHRAAGARYSRYSSQRVYRVARTLGWFALNGFGTRRHRFEADPREAERMLREWNRIKYDDAFSSPNDVDEYATESE